MSEQKYSSNYEGNHPGGQKWKKKYIYRHALHRFNAKVYKPLHLTINDPPVKPLSILATKWWPCHFICNRKEGIRDMLPVLRLCSRIVWSQQPDKICFEGYWCSQFLLQESPKQPHSSTHPHTHKQHCHFYSIKSLLSEYMISFSQNCEW